MKQTFIIIFLLIGINSYSQTGKASYVNRTSHSNHKKKATTALYKFGVGIQYSWPFTSFSGKLGVSEHSVFQAIISPFSYSNLGLTYYGGRYQYLFTNSSMGLFGDNAVDFPYLYFGLGVLRWSYTDFYDGATSYNILSYSAGAGYEAIIAKQFGVGLEAGYGVFSASGTTSSAAFTYGLGLHYYVGAGKAKYSHKKREGDKVEEDEKPVDGKDEDKDEDEKDNDSGDKIPAKKK